MKRIIKIFLLLLATIIPLNANALTYPNLHYKNAIVYDMTDDKVLYDLNSTETKPMASLTKIMTIITAIEHNENPLKTIVYTQEMKNNVSWEASKVGFKVGETLTFNDLLYGAMLPSGADATVALAITTSGSIDNFVQEMNNTAKRIGMTQSNFVNVHGLDAKNHYSTAKDIQILLEYALKNETFRQLYTTKEYNLSTGQLIKSTVKKQGEPYNLDISKIIGSKTGFTGDAGLCISVLMNYKDHEIIFITLGAPSSATPYHISDDIELINFIENNYDNQTLVEKDSLIKEIPIINSKQELYKVTSSTEIKQFLENDYNKEKIKIEYTGKEELSYKNKKGTTIGKIKYFYEDKLIYEEEVKLNIKIEPDILKILYANKVIVITIIVSLLFTIILFNDSRRGKKIKRKFFRR